MRDSRCNRAPAFFAGSGSTGTARARVDPFAEELEGARRPRHASGVPHCVGTLSSSVRAALTPIGFPGVSAELGNPSRRCAGSLHHQDGQALRRDRIPLSRRLPDVRMVRAIGPRRHPPSARSTNRRPHRVQCEFRPLAYALPRLALGLGRSCDDLERRQAKSLRVRAETVRRLTSSCQKVQIWSWSRQQWVTDLPSIRTVEKQVSKRSSVDQSGEPAPEIVDGRAERTGCQPTANGGLQERGVGALEFFLLDQMHH